jgi:hypothetical protein
LTDEYEIGYIISLPCVFLSALIIHFSCQYTGRPIKWAIALGWGINGVLFVEELAGLF